MRLKKEEGMRVIRSELKRKLIEERQGHSNKKRITILHKGPPAPFFASDEVSSMFNIYAILNSAQLYLVLIGIYCML